jgi:polyketide biosynthesis enoyl-CoA hydratase PksH
MGILDGLGALENLKVGVDGEVCYVQIHRPGANNAINDDLVAEFGEVLDRCEREVKVIVLEGLPEVFCFGADFKEIKQSIDGATRWQQDPQPLYDIWARLATGPYLTVAHVRGKVNAGGVGFVAACDLVLCEQRSTFSLSELLFGLIPACVMPFLIRRVGAAKANYMTLMTQPVGAQQALDWGLVDACGENSADLLRRHLLRLRLLSQPAIIRHKTYLNALDDSVQRSKSAALRANREVFADPDNLRTIARYVKTGQFPWE